MNKNILIVCLDKRLRKDLSLLLSKELNKIYLDVDELLDLELLNYPEISLTEAGEKLVVLEQKCINRALSYENCIITISTDMFISSNNFRLLKNLFKIFIQIPKSRILTIGNNRHSINQELLLYDEINSVVAKNCDETINSSNKLVQLIFKEIIEKIA